MTDSRIIIISLVAVCVVVLFKPPVDVTAKEILLFILGVLAGYMRREPVPPPGAQTTSISTTAVTPEPPEPPKK